MKAPHIKSSRTKQRFEFPNHLALLLTDIGSAGPVEYRYIMAVLDGETRKPCFFVTSEKTAGHDIFFLCVFDGDEHFNLGGIADEYADEKLFTEAALKIVKDRFQLDDSVSEEEETAEPRQAGDRQLDLMITVDGTSFPKVGEKINPATIQYAGLAKPGLLGRMMLSKIKTDPNDEIYFKKNGFIQCRKFNDHLNGHERFGITSNTERGNGQMWGNTIVIAIDSGGHLKKVLIQIIMNRGIAELNLQQFRSLCAKAFGPPMIATEEVFVWQDEKSTITSARNGDDAVFEWTLN